ncbi:MAG: thioredoxin family protein [Pseudomonadota bacterium]
MADRSGLTIMMRDRGMRILKESKKAKASKGGAVALKGSQQSQRRIVITINTDPKEVRHFKNVERILSSYQRSGVRQITLVVNKYPTKLSKRKQRVLLIQRYSPNKTGIKSLLAKLNQLKGQKIKIARLELNITGHGCKDAKGDEGIPVGKSCFSLQHVAKSVLSLDPHHLSVYMDQCRGGGRFMDFITPNNAWRSSIVTLGSRNEDVYCHRLNPYFFSSKHAPNVTKIERLWYALEENRKKKAPVGSLVQFHRWGPRWTLSGITKRLDFPNVKTSRNGIVYPYLFASSVSDLKNLATKKLKPGQKMLVVLSANWCGNCHTLLQPRFREFIKRFGGSFLPVWAEKPKSVGNDNWKDLLSYKKGVQSFPNAFPSMVVINRHGIVTIIPDQVRKLILKRRFLSAYRSLAYYFALSSRHQHINIVPFYLRLLKVGNRTQKGIAVSLLITTLRFLKDDKHQLVLDRVLNYIVATISKGRKEEADRAVRGIAYYLATINSIQRKSVFKLLLKRVWSSPVKEAAQIYSLFFRILKVKFPLSFKWEMLSALKSTELLKQKIALAILVFSYRQMTLNTDEIDLILSRVRAHLKNGENWFLPVRLWMRLIGRASASYKMTDDVKILFSLKLSGLTRVKINAELIKRVDNFPLQINAMIYLLNNAQSEVMIMQLLDFFMRFGLTSKTLLSYLGRFKDSKNKEIIGRVLSLLRDIGPPANGYLTYVERYLNHNDQWIRSVAKEAKLNMMSHFEHRSYLLISRRPHMFAYGLRWLVKNFNSLTPRQRKGVIFRMAHHLSYKRMYQPIYREGFRFFEKHPDFLEEWSYKFLALLNSRYNRSGDFLSQLEWLKTILQHQLLSVTSLKKVLEGCFELTVKLPQKPKYRSRLVLLLKNLVFMLSRQDGVKFRHIIDFSKFVKVWLKRSDGSDYSCRYYQRLLKRVMEVIFKNAPLQMGKIVSLIHDGDAVVAKRVFDYLIENKRYAESYLEIAVNYLNVKDRQVILKTMQLMNKTSPYSSRYLGKLQALSLNRDPIIARAAKAAAESITDHFQAALNKFYKNPGWKELSEIRAYKDLMPLRRNQLKLMMLKTLVDSAVNYKGTAVIAGMLNLLRKMRVEQASLSKIVSQLIVILKAHSESIATTKFLKRPGRWELRKETWRLEMLKGSLGNRYRAIIRLQSIMMSFPGYQNRILKEFIHILNTSQDPLRFHAEDLFIDGVKRYVYFNHKTIGAIDIIRLLEKHPVPTYVRKNVVKAIQHSVQSGRQGNSIVLKLISLLREGNAKRNNIIMLCLKDLVILDLSVRVKLRSLKRDPDPFVQKALKSMIF